MTALLCYSHKVSMNTHSDFIRSIWTITHLHFLYSKHSSWNKEHCNENILTNNGLINYKTVTWKIFKKWWKNPNIITNVNITWVITSSSCPVFFTYIELCKGKVGELSRFKGKGKLCFYPKLIWSYWQTWHCWLRMRSVEEGKEHSTWSWKLMLPTLPLISKVKLKSSFSPSGFNPILYKIKS